MKTQHQKSQWNEIRDSLNAKHYGNAEHYRNARGITRLLTICSHQSQVI